MSTSMVCGWFCYLVIIFYYGKETKIQNGYQDEKYSLKWNTSREVSVQKPSKQMKHLSF